MKTDKNTVIGFVLLAGLFFTYFWYTNKQQTEAQAYKQRFDDSVALVKTTAEKAVASKNPIKVETASQKGVIIDTVKEEFTLIENDLMIVRFSNKGGQIAGVTLKSYPNSTKTKVVLGDSTNLNYPVILAIIKPYKLTKLYFRLLKLPRKMG